MRNLWCLEKISILLLIISATGIVPQSLFKNLKILDLGNTLVVEIQKGILLYSCHIVRKLPYRRLPHWKRFIFYSYIYVCIYLLKSNHVNK
jgi:hypothetical protein